MSTLMLVLVGTTVPVSGSLVLGVVLMPLTRVKLLPVTVPCVCTDAAPGGVFTVASYLMVTLLPTFSTTGRLNETVSPENGMTVFEVGAIVFAADGPLARPPPVSITDSEPLLTRGLRPRSVVASLLLRKFKVEAKAATGFNTCRSHANVVGEALPPLV